MRRSNLAGAIIAGIGGTLGLTASVQAINLNPLGTGQVLIFPYYTVNAGNQTLISVVNKTDAGKAVKVRFLEGRNSREVMDFNLYLSPFDVWTASVFSLSDTGPSNPGNLVTTDNSCTVPRLKGNVNLPALSNGNRYAPFFNYAYIGPANPDAGPDSLDRSREGHFEMIEMGEVVDRERVSLTDITHSGGVPNNCSRVMSAWLPPSSGSTVAYWTFNELIDMDPPQGGLFGNAAIVDALAGTMMSYNADAIDAFSDIAQHTNPGDLKPNLTSARSSADTAIAYVFSDGVLVTSSYPQSRAIDAVSALFMQNEIFNEFVTSTSVGAISEWVVTFPTKFAYTDQDTVGNTPIAPFTRLFPRSSTATNTGTANVDLSDAVFNREAFHPNGPCPPDQCIPFPGSPEPPRPQWSWATQVITFSQQAAETAGSSLLGSRLVFNFPVIDQGVFDGWAKMLLHSTPVSATPVSATLIEHQRMRPDNNGGIWNGLPITGFWAASYTNGQLTPGVLSNYAAAYKHRGSNQYVPVP